ncbi:hypothetical protein BDZ89DRAFT_1039618 [Hymenopellis radicata]|nr:hypothetical protein BDZ89DRAFT_1039618 [Hymenopellis radicata]
MFEKTKCLMMHWPCTVMGGDPGHCKTASTWQEAKKSTSKCLGYLKCTNDECQVLVRPHTTTSSRVHQLEKASICGAPLRHIQCTGGDDGKYIVAITHTWSGGVRFINSGFHRHPRHSPASFGLKSGVDIQEVGLRK